jgi:hypothetical protein
MLIRLLPGFVVASKATLSRLEMENIGRITRTCEDAQTAQNYPLRTGKEAARNHERNEIADKLKC